MNGFGRVIRGVLGTCLATLALAGCALVSAPTAPGPHAALQEQRVAAANQALEALAAVDAVVSFRNDFLESIIADGLAQALGGATLSGRQARVNVDFSPQWVAFRAGDTNGEIRFRAEDDALTWWPVIFESGSDAPAATPEWVTRLQAEGLNRIDIGLTPLAVLEAGVRMSGGVEAVSDMSVALQGLPVRQGSAIWIGAEVTRLALDLDLLPGVTDCGPGQENTTARVINYGYADGIATGVWEGARGENSWPASMPSGLPFEREWRIYQVDADSGCLRQALGSEAPAQVRDAGNGVTFEDFSERFGQRVEPVSPDVDLSAPVRIELARQRLASMLQTVLADQVLNAELPVQPSVDARWSATMAPPPSRLLACDSAECMRERQCTVNHDRCPLERDTRSCSSCQLRNPLNNRCLSEVEDPGCLQARDARNQRLEQERASCIDAETVARDACVALREQEVQQCRADRADRLQTCQARLASLEGLAPSASVGEITASGRVSGTVEVALSGFSIDPGLSRLRMTITSGADLESSGQLRFTPTSAFASILPCTSGWAGPYSGFAEWQRRNDQWITVLAFRGGRLEAQWSGQVLPLELAPAPLASLFRKQPGLLSGCGLGFSPDIVTSALSGSGAGFFHGYDEVVFQPLTTRMSLLPAWIRAGGRTLTGTPSMDGQRFSYELGMH